MSLTSSLKHLRWLPVALAAVIVLGIAPAFAQQQVPYDQDFDGAAAGWDLHGLWAVDGSPASMPGGSAYSGPGSLNFNNGVDYQGMQRASCQSPSIAGMAPRDHVVRFRCNYRTETTGSVWDQRTVVIRANSEVVQQHLLGSSSSTPADARCAAMGAWHTHEFLVPGSTATRALFFHVEFVFDSVDTIANGFPGWFIDDFQLEAVAPVSVPEFTSVTRTTVNFRDLSTTVAIGGDRSVEIRRSQPNVRFALVTGQATDAEWQALNQAIHVANLASIPASIPDTNVYIVRPTTSVLTVLSAIPNNVATISSSAGVYQQWAPQLVPVMAPIEAIAARLLGAGGGTGDDHGNAHQMSTTLSLDPAMPAATGAIDPAGDVDYFQFADIQPMIAIFPAPQRTYTIETTVTGTMDTVIHLYGSDGTTPLATNDDGGQGLASRIVYTGTQGVPLFVKVRHYSASGTGSYTIRVTSVAVPGPTPIPLTDDHGNTPSTATTISTGASNAGSVDPAGDFDYFTWVQFAIAIFPPPQYTHVIETSVIGGMDTVIYLYAADGTTLLASNDDAPGMGWASRIVYTGPASTYYVKVRHYSGSGTGDYTLTVNQTQAP